MSCVVSVWSTCNPRSTNFDYISGICMKLCRSKSRKRMEKDSFTLQSLQGDQSSSFGSSGERHDADERQGWRWSVVGQGILGIWWGGWQLGLVWRIFLFSVDNGYEEGRKVCAWFSMWAIVNCRYVRKYESMETTPVVPKPVFLSMSLYCRFCIPHARQEAPPNRRSTLTLKHAKIIRGIATAYNRLTYVLVG